MITQMWYELKNYLDEEIEIYNSRHDYLSYAYHSMLRNKMTEIESKFFCQSLKEAGY